MIGEWIAGAESATAILRRMFPGWENVEVRFTVKPIGLGFRCNDKGLGDFRVWVVDCDLDDVAYIEGKNADTPALEIGYNLRNYENSVLEEIFHMARCRRELERTGKIDLARQFEKHRANVIARLAPKSKG